MLDNHNCASSGGFSAVWQTSEYFGGASGIEGWLLDGGASGIQGGLLYGRVHGIEG